jgi:hypothetical protein
MNAFARLAWIASLPLISSAGGCANQSQGQRCDTTADCQSPLVCTPIAGCEYGLCEPAGTSLSGSACNVGGDASSDASTEAATDASIDSAVEAAPEPSAEPGDETDGATE